MFSNEFADVLGITVVRWKLRLKGTINGDNAVTPHLSDE
jgi:hypothetical protein